MRLPTAAGVRRRWSLARFQLRFVARATGRRHVVVLGDSHVRVFQGWPLDGFRFDVLSVGGATASGIRNPNSRSDALPRFRRRLAMVRPWQEVLVCLGEVDCGYVIWRRAREHGTTAEAECQEALARYEAFLREEVLAARPQRLSIMTAPLPTLPDNSAEWGEIARRRADVQVDRSERTALTLAFNEGLVEIAARLGAALVETTKEQVDPTTGHVRPDLVLLGEGDHHLRDGPYRELIESALRRLDRSAG